MIQLGATTKVLKCRIFMYHSTAKEEYIFLLGEKDSQRMLLFFLLNFSLLSLAANWEEVQEFMLNFM